MFAYFLNKGGLLSNFPGTQIDNVSASKELKETLDSIFGKDMKYISSVSCVASIRDKAKTENKNFVQGMEKFIDTMQGKPYTALFIADPILPEQQSEIRSGYESLYSILSSFQKSVWSYNENESSAVMNSLSKGISDAVTIGSSKTQSHTLTHVKGTNSSNGIGAQLGVSGSFTNSTSTSTTHTEPTTNSRAASATKHILTAVGTIAGAIIGDAVPVLGTMLGKAVGEGLGGAIESIVGNETIAHSITQSIARTLGGSLGLNANHSWGRMESDSVSDGTSDSTNRSTSLTTSRTTTSGTTDTTGTGCTLQIESINKPIAEMLKRIEEQLKRVQEGEDYGAYSCGAYFLSGRQENSLLAANTYRALMLGEGSAVESGAVNSWEDTNIVSTMKEYLRRFAQPLFAVPITDGSMECMVYSPSTIVSGLELPLHLGLPTRSVVGLPVIKYAEFGKEVSSYRTAQPDDGTSQSKLSLGSVFDMGQETKRSVSLDKESLTMHTFITGSTGSGKSNTIYHLLDEVSRKKVRFLVVEPAKGEYKSVFGGREDVSVYGTNVRKAPLIRLNPFSFPDDIHVLEHIDRLVEIMNACWPMYAAMPAVLKDAVEQAYRSKGWDLTNSFCASEEFPTFTDLMNELPKIIEQSAYSADTKSDYIGSLVTRVKSLTNGINGQIFCSMAEITIDQILHQDYA